MAEFKLPAGMTVTAAARAISELVDVRNGRNDQRERAYYDTFDGRLHAEGLIAVWEDGHLALIARGDDRVLARARVAKPVAPVLASQLPAGRLAEALRPLISIRALLPLVELHGQERPLDVLDREGKTVVRVLVLQPVVGGRRLSPRAQIRPVRGYDKAYRRVCQTVEASLSLEPAPPLVDEAVTVAGGNPAGSPSRPEVELSAEQRSDVAARLLLEGLLGVIEANLEGAIKDLDSEFLHDLRVAVRRTRALQRELRGVFPPDRLERFRAEFRWLQQVTGDARDLDVYLLEFESMCAPVPEPARGELEPLQDVLGAQRVLARRRMARALRSDRTRNLLTEWRKLLEQLESLPEDDRPRAAEPIGRLAAARITKVYRRMLRMGEAIALDTPPAEYHELRKQGKELRYLLELVGAPLYPEAPVKSMLKSLKALQDVLGQHQDREVQVGMLRSLGPEVAAAAGGSAALMAMGMLVERLEADQVAARQAFAEGFATFALKPPRRLVRDTFR
ncbi:MAG: CHAD domain-containing protein [Solirubrobacterales bacterium]|nr:CHAD domain-containing protein [Solirubrobacterales bacterium]